jgi:hypothetical protein
MASNDQIAVELVAKTDQYNAALNSSASATEAFGSRVKNATAGAESGVSRLTGAIGEFAASFASAFIGALSVEKIIDLGRESIETADKINKMSQQVGIATDSLSALQSQAALSDVGFDQFGQAMQRLARSSAEAAGGAQQQSAAYAAMGISVTNAAGQMRPMQEILQDVANKMATYKDSAAKTALAQELFGRSGAQLIPLLNELGTRGFDEVKKHAEEYNQVIGPDQARQAEEFNDNLTRMRQGVSGFANAVTGQLLPVLVRYTDDLANAAKTNDRYAESASSVASAVKVIIFALQALWEASKITTDLTYGVVKASAEAGKALVTEGIGAAAGKFKALGAEIGGSVADLKKGFDSLFGTFSNVSAGVSTTASAAQKANAPIVNLGKSARDAAKDMAAFNAEESQAASMLAALSAKANPASEAYERYVATLIAISKEYDQIVAKGKAAGQTQQALAYAQDFLKQATDSASQALDRNLAALERQRDIAGHYEQSLADENRLLGLNADQQEIMTAILQAEATARKQYNDGLRESAELTDDERQRIIKAAEAHLQLKHAVEDSDQATRDWINIWQQAGDQLASTFASILVNGGSLFDQLASLAKQTVQQIIAYFAKLAIINPILNAIFGTAITGGAGLLPTLASAGVSAAAGGGGGAGIMDYVSGGNSAYGAYGLFSGAGGAQTLQGSLFGTGDFDVGWGNYLSSGGGMGGALGTAGGVFGGYYLGQKYLGGTAGGIAGAAGLGAAAYFVPIIGWIAGAIALIDWATGGGLLGTDANKFNFGQQAVNIGAGGANVTAGFDLKGKKPLFGGSYHEWHSATPDPAAVDAWNQFFTSVMTGNEAFATSIGGKAGDIAAAQFAQNFDKHGNITGSTTTIAGHTYSGDTTQQFQERVIAETMINTMAQMDSALSDAVDQYRANADQFYAITQQLGNAAVYLHNGGQFLALGTDQSLTALLKLAQGSQQFGETIDQTLQRLMQAQAQYDQFVGQFKPAATYVDDFEATLSQINAQMNQNIATANALAQAAGAEGASEQDLANIHQYAANQMAAALRQLEASAQGLAFSLGLTSIGSLDAVNQEIAQLQAKANAGRGAIRGFGDAMQAAAQKAKDAMSLLLGDLSPLNDADKLQKALQGLRAGTATQEQVLAIGRRLYASSQAYTDLFNQVMSMGTGAAGGSQFAAAGHGGGLTAGENERLQQLLKEQQRLQAAAQLQQYQTLAQQIAEIASAKGEDWQQVVSDMGIDLKAFEKGLGMNDAQLDAYIKNFQALKDSNGENTKMIVDVLNAILVQLGGTPIGDSGGSGTGDTGGTGTPRGHSGHGGGRDPRVDQIIDGFSRIILQQPRSQRTRGVMPVGGA